MEIICDYAELLTSGMFDNYYCENFMYVSKSIQIRGIKYVSDDCVIMDIDENQYVKILQIKNIFLKDHYKDVCFYGKCFLMIFNYREGLYELIKKIDDYKHVFYVELINIFPFKILKLNNEILLSLPHSICK